MTVFVVPSDFAFRSVSNVTERVSYASDVQCADVAVVFGVPLG